MGTETTGNAANHIVIGGKYFTDLLDHNKGTLTASSALIVDSDKKLDELLVDNLSLNGSTLGSTADLKINTVNGIELNGTVNKFSSGPYAGTSIDFQSYELILRQDRGGGISLKVGADGTVTSTFSFNNDGSLTVPGTIKTLSNGDLTLSPNGTGKVSIAGAYTLPRADGTADYVLTTDGSGNVTWQPKGIPTFSITTASLGLSSLSYSNGTFTFTPPDLSSYATQTYVNEKGYATTATINSLIANSLTNYATQTYVTSQGYITSSALSGYATESYVTTQGFITGISGSDVTTALGYTPLQSSDLSGYATESYVTTQGYITISALSEYTTTATVNSLIASSLTNYATQSYVDTKGYTTTATVNSLIASSLTNYATQSYVDTKGYTTTATVNSLIASSLTNYALTSAIPTDNNQLSNGSGYITSSALSGYATESYVTTQGYITTSSLSGYATESYVQTVAQGLHIHEPVKAATTASLASITGGSVTYDNSSSGVGATLTLGSALTVLDGYTLQDGDRVLVKNESAQANNGIYTWATGGTVLTRDIYEDETSQFAGGDFIFVSNGTANGDTGWVQTEHISSFGSSDIIFQQFAGAGTYQADTGLSLTGNIFSISTTYVGQGSITTLGTVSAGTWTATTIGAGYGGTGLTSYSAYDLIYGNSSGPLGKLQMGQAGQILQVNTTGNAIIYSDIDGGTY
jgi:hypothetical protein